MKPVRDMRDAFNAGLEWREVHQGVIIAEKVLIAKNKSRWKKLGEMDWHSYYGLSNLCEAIKNNRLDEYALEQDINGRAIMAPVVNNSFTRQTVFKSKKGSKKFNMKGHTFYDLTDEEIKLVIKDLAADEQNVLEFARRVIKLFRSKNV